MQLAPPLSFLGILFVLQSAGRQAVEATPLRNSQPNQGIKLPLYRVGPSAPSPVAPGQQGLSGKRSALLQQAEVDKTWAHGRNQVDYLRGKYGRNSSSARVNQTENHARSEDGLVSNARRGNAPLTVVGTDTYYYAPIGFGTPAQTLGLVLDTGSSTYSSVCTSTVLFSRPPSRSFCLRKCHFWS